MPRKATDILSIDQAAWDLRIDGDLGTEASPTPVRTAVLRAINSAVEYCEGLTAKPLIDRPRTEMVARPVRANYPMQLDSIYVLSIESIAYWKPMQALRQEPTGTVLVAYADPNAPLKTEDPIGRKEVYDRHWTAVWPPAAGWPATLTDSRLRVTYTEGIADPLPGLDGIRQAVTVMAGANYDGIVSDRYEAVVRRLLQPFVDARWQL